ncbi:MAG: hypothetical protein CL912_00795 [Deltaproteobacteria bacterium]|nr:hypothetical protein [Deltaproteobacteria bacterium]
MYSTASSIYALLQNINTILCKVDTQKISVVWARGDGRSRGGKTSLVEAALMRPKRMKTCLQLNL